MYEIFYNLQKKAGEPLPRHSDPQNSVRTESLESLLNTPIPESHPADCGSISLEWEPGGLMWVPLTVP